MEGDSKKGEEKKAQEGEMNPGRMIDRRKEARKKKRKYRLRLKFRLALTRYKQNIGNIVSMANIVDIGNKNIS